VATVVFDCGLYTCCQCLCPIQGKALLATDDEGLRRSYHPGRCDLLKPGVPRKWEARGAARGDSDRRLRPALQGEPQAPSTDRSNTERIAQC